MRTAECGNAVCGNAAQHCALGAIMHAIWCFISSRAGQFMLLNGLDSMLTCEPLCMSGHENVATIQLTTKRYHCSSHARYAAKHLLECSNMRMSLCHDSLGHVRISMIPIQSSTGILMIFIRLIKRMCSAVPVKALTHHQTGISLCSTQYHAATATSMSKSQLTLSATALTQYVACCGLCCC